VSSNLAGGAKSGGDFTVRPPHLELEQAFVFRLELGAYRRAKLVHQLYRHILLLLQVTVDVHGDGEFGVPQNLGDHDYRDAVIEH
jgi:hypothetical protein